MVLLCFLRRVVELCCNLNALLAEQEFGDVGHFGVAAGLLVVAGGAECFHLLVAAEAGESLVLDHDFICLVRAVVLII